MGGSEALSRGAALCLAKVREIISSMVGRAQRKYIRHTHPVNQHLQRGPFLHGGAESVRSELRVAAGQSQYFVEPGRL